MIETERSAGAVVLSRHVALPSALSFLCLLHCLGVGLLAPLLPGAMALLVEHELLEWGLLLTTCFLAVGLLWRQRRAVSLWPFLASVALSLMAVVGLVTEREAWQQVAIAGVCCVQVGVLLASRRARLRARTS